MNKKKKYAEYWINVYEYYFHPEKHRFYTKFPTKELAIDAELTHEKPLYRIHVRLK